MQKIKIIAVAVMLASFVSVASAQTTGTHTTLIKEPAATTVTDTTSGQALTATSAGGTMSAQAMPTTIMDTTSGSTVKHPAGTVTTPSVIKVPINTMSGQVPSTALPSSLKATEDKAGQVPSTTSAGGATSVQAPTATTVMEPGVPSTVKIPMGTESGGPVPSAAPASGMIKQEIQNAQETIKAVRQGVFEETKGIRVTAQQEAQIMKQSLNTEAETLRANLQNSLKAIKSDTSITSQEAQEAAVKAREEVKATLQERIESTKQVIMENRAEFQNQIKIRREEAKQTIELEKAELQKKLQVIKDEKKKQAVTDIAEKIQQANVNYLERLTTVLSNIEEVLRGVSSRADKAVLAGKDVTQVRVDITEAETMIAAVRGYISAQSSTTYPVEITDEANLRADVASTRDRLHTDLSVIKDEVKKVHESVKKAASDLTKIPQVNQEAVVEE